MPTNRQLRSALYTPGTKPAVLHKALQSCADMLIFDLKDAVAPDAKAQARESVASVLAAAGEARARIVVRVNGLDTPWCADDVRAFAPSGAAALLFPKIGIAAMARAADRAMAEAGAPEAMELWCMVETPGAILNVAAIAAEGQAGAPRLRTLVMGTNDLVKDMPGRAPADRANLLPALSTAVLAARAHGLDILDGEHNGLDDEAALECSCVQGRDLGFDGRTLIHPAQLAACHRVYSPDADEVRLARAILAAFALPGNQGVGVLKVEGRMVELLHSEMARRTVEIADAIAARARV